MCLKTSMLLAQRHNLESCLKVVLFWFQIKILMNVSFIRTLFPLQNTEVSLFEYNIRFLGGLLTMFAFTGEKVTFAPTCKSVHLYLERTSHTGVNMTYEVMTYYEVCFLATIWMCYIIYVRTEAMIVGLTSVEDSLVNSQVHRITVHLKFQRTL